MNSGGSEPLTQHRVGVIGLGEIGQYHLRGYESTALANVAAVADIDEAVRRESAAANGAAAYADYRDLLADEGVDIVSVCLPHNLHRDVVLEAIAAGKSVLVEKPLALDTAECDEIAAAAQSSGVTVGVQHNQLFYPAHVRARELIESGAVGRVLHIRLRLAIGGKYGGWRSDPASVGGGLLHDAGAHRFYLARFLGGEIEELVALTDRIREEGEDQAVVALRFAGGALGVIDVNYHGPDGMFDDSVEVVGSDAALYISGCEAEFEGFRTGPALRRYDGTWHDERVEPGNWADSVSASVAAFVEAVAKGEEPPVGVADGRRVLELIESVHESAAPVGSR